MFSQKYLDDVLVRMAHHSSGIEGNTITLPETVSIILEQFTPIGGKSIREFFEIENHRQAFEYVLGQLARNENLTITTIQEIHALLMDRLQFDRGNFKTQQNAIVGAMFDTATPQETPILMKQWVDNTVYRLEQANNHDELLVILADTHIQFERIHPFSDGNGRAGRLILLYLGMKTLGLPVMIMKEQRAEYMESLAKQDVQSLANQLKVSLEFEGNRSVLFQ